MAAPVIWLLVCLVYSVQSQFLFPDDPRLSSTVGPQRSQHDTIVVSELEENLLSALDQSSIR